jgi:hypothetical protein
MRLVNWRSTWASFPSCRPRARAYSPGNMTAPCTSAPQRSRAPVPSPQGLPPNLLSLREARHHVHSVHQLRTHRRRLAFVLTGPRLALMTELSHRELIASLTRKAPVLPKKEVAAVWRSPASRSASSARSAASLRMRHRMTGAFGRSQVAMPADRLQAEFGECLGSSN